MSTTDSNDVPATWHPVEPDVAAALHRYECPLEALAAGDIPAIVLRNAYPVSTCRKLVHRLVTEGHLFDARQPVPPNFVDASIPEGFFREGTAAMRAWQTTNEADSMRIDIGTSLGYRGSDQDAFFAHAEETRALFQRLFSTLSPTGERAGREFDVVEILYDYLQQLAPKYRVKTAYEQDGRQYGPAIIRAHYGGYAYKPHFDSVRLREKRTDYAVYQFEHQFAGVLVLSNGDAGQRGPECRLYRCPWQPALDAYLSNDTFHEYAARHDIQTYDIRLNPGDLYFFNTRMIHEVPGARSLEPRVVLATFIGYSRDAPEIFVWS